jgi:hypothetical protein
MVVSAARCITFTAMFMAMRTAMGTAAADGQHAAHHMP